MIESKRLTPGERDAFQDMLPPDGYEPDWKKQIKAMDRHTAARARSERIAFFGGGFTVAAFVPGMYELKVAAVVALVIWFAVCVGVAVKTHLAAREIDRKLDDGVRIE